MVHQDCGMRDKVALSATCKVVLGVSSSYFVLYRDQDNISACFFLCPVAPTCGTNISQSDPMSEDVREANSLTWTARTACSARPSFLNRTFLDRSSVRCAQRK